MTEENFFFFDYSINNVEGYILWRLLFQLMRLVPRLTLKLQVVLRLFGKAFITRPVNSVE